MKKQFKSMTATSCELWEEELSDSLARGKPGLAINITYYRENVSWRLIFFFNSSDYQYLKTNDTIKRFFGLLVFYFLVSRYNFFQRP